jgi:hypothetical protein
MSLKSVRRVEVGIEGLLRSPPRYAAPEIYALDGIAGKGQPLADALIRRGALLPAQRKVRLLVPDPRSQGLR